MRKLYIAMAIVLATLVGAALVARWSGVPIVQHMDARRDTSQMGDTTSDPTLVTRADTVISVGSPGGDSTMGRPAPAPTREWGVQASAPEAGQDSGALGFNAPDAMLVGEIKRIHAVLYPGTDTARVRGSIQEPGKVRTEVVETSDSAELQLRGSAFEIKPLYPERRRISRTRRTEWLWEVQPKHDGPQVLVLTLYALVNDEGTRDWVPVQTFRDTVLVTVKTPPRKTFSEWVGPFLEKNWAPLLTIILIPVGAAVWRLLRGRKKEDA